MKTLAIMGECMLELSRLPTPELEQGFPMKMFFGGDTLNTALYMARLGSKVDYITALGDDPSSHWMKQQWTNEGIGCDLVSHQGGASPGLYMIETQDDGERTFSYWRDNSPATRLFNDIDTSQTLLQEIGQYEYFMFSGITLSLYPELGLNRLLTGLKPYVKSGGKLIFDGNYRPKLWASKAQARAAYDEVYQHCEVALPTFEDEQLLYGDATPEDTLARLHTLGVKLIVLKMGGDGCLVSKVEPGSDGAMQHVPATTVTPIDTTAAGDSFNAAFLNHYIKNLDAVSATQAGHKLANRVIQHRGAILPLDKMPA